MCQHKIHCLDVLALFYLSHKMMLVYTVSVVTSCRKQLVDSFDFVSASTEPLLLVGKQPPILFLNVELGRIRQAEAGAEKGRLNYLSRQL